MPEQRRRRRRPTPATPLSNPRGTQERILAFGVEGTGKSESWIDIAVKAQESNSDAQFFVIDTDGSAEVSLSAHPPLDNIQIWQASDPNGALILPDGTIKQFDTGWEAFATAAQEVRTQRPSPNDWLVIDRVDRLWDSIQAYWIERAYGSDEETYWAELRAEQLERLEKEGKGTDRDYGGFTGNRDWPQIKRIHNKEVLGLLAGPPCHKFAVALEKDIHPQSKKAQQLRGLYGEVMPAGQADQGANYFLTLHFKRAPGGDHLIFTRRTKRRDFESPGAIEITDVGFVDGYLRPVWGWV